MLSISHRLAAPALILLHGAAVGQAPAPPAPAAADTQSALSYELAFDTRQFLWSTALAIVPDGSRVAYAGRLPPADTNLDARFMPNGSPSSVVGSRVYVTDRETGRTTDVCPGGNCWRPAWSPDGRRLAFYSDRDGPPQLWLHDVDAGTPRKLSDVVVKAKLWIGDEPKWSPDGRTLFVPLAPAGGSGAAGSSGTPEMGADPDSVSLVTVLKSGSEADPESGPEGPSPMAAHMLRENNADLAAIDAATGTVRVLVDAATDPRPAVLRVSPSGRWVSYLSVFQPQAITNQVSTMDLALVPATGGEVHVVAENLPLLDDYHRLSYAWHPTDDRLIFMKDGQLWLVDVGSTGPGAPSRIAADLGQLAPTVHWFTRDGSAVVVGIDPVDDEAYGDPRPTGLARVPLDGGTPRAFHFGEGWVWGEVLKSDGRTIWQPRTGAVSVLLKEVATGETAVVGFDFESGHESVLWKGLARLENVSGGGAHDALFATYQDVSTPPDVYRFPADFSARERVSHLDPRLDGVAAGTVEVFESTVPLHDGSLGRVRTAVLLPAGAKRGDRLPALVGIYPGGDVSNRAELFGGGATLTVPNLLFTSRGYAVVLAHLKLGPNRSAGQPLQEMVDVLLPQVYRAAELGYVDPARLAVGGQSYGGYGTASIISGTNLFRAAIAVSGIYDLPGTYGHLREDGGSFWIGWAEGGQARMGTHPWADLRRYTDNSPYYRADRIHTPVLLVHGDEDMAIHDARKLFSALRRLERPAQLAQYAGQGHVVSNWTRAAAADAARRMVEFLNRHLNDGR